MQIAVISLFREMIDGYLSVSVLSKARERGIFSVDIYDPRDYTTDVHRTVDDAPFGGGPGMVMMCQPVFDLVAECNPPKPMIALSPGGRRLDHSLAVELSALDGFTLLCGRYEGLDQRIIDQLVDFEVSVGDYVLAGGELAALSVIESTVRLVPGVLGNAKSSSDESFADGLLEYPHYTRPASFMGLGVPEVLVSGNHALIAEWRKAAALYRTLVNRPDLIKARGGLSEADERILAKHGYSYKVSE
ncbi:MAG: tRNA (guanosine(37)-N1)-methyltransferase TrmD [Actinomycetota bacterium]|nr:MAG: tRNA (guanosine(37)-N1)-methyltransferase TrmD [Actinomycetota bacterium]